MFREIIKFLATGAYSGYSPYAPGTAGTVVALVLIYIFPFHLLSWPYFLLIVVISFLICQAYLHQEGLSEEIHDPGELVIDEILGYWIAAYGLTGNLMLLVAFLLFRLLDIFKPYPISRLESLKGALGVIADDIVSGIMTRVLILIITYIS